MEPIRITVIIYAVITALGTIGYLLKKKKYDLRNRPNTWLQVTPYFVNLTHGMLVGLAYFGIGVLEMPTLAAQITSGI